jgi:KipI family sensor histidine kinase inhibitor
MSGEVVVPYGSGATFVDLRCEGAPDRVARTHALAAAIRRAWPEADVVVGAGTLAVVGVTADEVRRLAPVGAGEDASPGRSHTVHVVYDGPDLDAVAAALGVSTAEVVARHAGAEYLVELVGFLPGFAYLGAPPGWPLAVPRRPAPRPRVPAGSVAVAAAFTAIYPFASPGGWNIIGRSVDTVPFDAARDPPVLFGPGDRVRFAPSSSVDPLPSASPRVDGLAPARGLLIVAAPVCATVQDRGRPGQLGRGIPPSGPLDAEAFAAANVAAGNPIGAAAVEVPQGSLEVEARGGPAVVSVDGEPPVRLAEGERFRVVETDRAVRYLAVSGGVDVPAILGARSTLLAARLGGHLGRPLRRGDLLAVGADGGGAPSRSPAAPFRRDDVLLVDPGPHRGRFPPGAYEALLAGGWRVSRLGDRVGVRLEGARVRREGLDLALPAPMIRGAIEITTDGTPIVLGPDHPTTGGYPVLAVLRASSQSALARRRPGEAVMLVDAGSQSGTNTGVA